MKLNIHLISHPLIQHLSNITKNPVLSSNITNQALKHLGLFVIYESLRKWLKIYKLIIKKTTGQKEITMIDPKESYTIIFNNVRYLSMFQEIQLLLPKLNLQLLTNQDIYSIDKKKSVCSDLNLSTKIIIVNYEMDIDYTQNILNYLIKTSQINIHQIRLTYIACATNQLVQLSDIYNNLNIYTTNIVKN